MFDALEGCEGRLSPGRTDPTASRHARPALCPAAPPCPAPTRPARGMSVVFELSNSSFVESQTRISHGRGGAERRTVGQGGEAGRGRAGWGRGGAAPGHQVLAPDPQKTVSSCRKTPRKHGRRKSYVNRHVESKTRTQPGRVGTGRRTAGRRGRAGTGSTGRRRVGSPRRKLWVIRASPDPFVSQNFPVGLRRDRVDIIQLRFNFLCPFGLLLTRLSCSWVSCV